VPDDGNNGGGIVEDKKGNDIIIPESYNYIGVFLTFACQLRCWYCINHEKGNQPNYKTLTGKEWVEGLNRIKTREGLPITLQGGEPTCHPDFYEIVNGIKTETEIDLLTNIQFDTYKFIQNVDPERIKREAPYASIRVSYHPSTMSLVETIERVKGLQEAGFKVGVWIVDHPQDRLIKYYQRQFVLANINCRLKEYLDGGKYGTYKYMGLQGTKNVLCKPSELLMAPYGSIHRCHGDLYGNKPAYANILDDNVRLVDGFIPCKRVECNSCDHKIKTNRFQIYGHAAVEIKEQDEV
jgi:hypothetical protein